MLLEDMVGGIEKTSNLVQEISVASSEQAAGITQVNKSIQQLEIIIQSNASSAEEMAASSRDFSAQAEHLLNAASIFDISGAETASTEATQEEKDVREVGKATPKNGSDAPAPTDENVEGDGFEIELEDDAHFEQY